MKRILSIFLLTLLSAAMSAQITEHPYVESQYHSDYGDINVIGVIVEDGKTLVLLEDITLRGVSGLWISFSDKTVIAYGNTSRRIISWGYWDGENVQEMSLNRQYSLQADRKYNFVLVFPAIPAGTRLISVRENISGGFYWNKIHLDASSGYSSGGSSSSGSNSWPKNGGAINNSPSQGSGQSGWRDYRESPEADHFDPVGSGTCFAISQDGYLATCYHVIEDARDIRIRGINGDFSKLYRARVVASDSRNDLAILKITDASFTSIPGIPYTISGNVSEVGEDVFVLGYPLRAVMGDEIKLTNGLISSKSGYQGDATCYQISATVQPGNSGGPLFDGNGNVIGVVNARLMVESAAYAVKTPYLKKLSESVDYRIAFPSVNRLSGKSLKDQVKDINRFVYIIEVE